MSGWVILSICSLPGNVVRVGHQDRCQVKLPIMLDMSDGHEGIEAYHRLQSRREELSVLCWNQHAVLNTAMANLVHLGIEANNGLLPSGCVPVRCVDIGGTKRVVRSTWHFHQPSTQVAAYDAAIGLQRYAVLSSKFSRDANDQRQGFCLLGMHQETSSVPSPWFAYR